MKKGIHPQYHDNAIITCACGARFRAGSTVKEPKTELCSNCHPFFTGKQKLVDSAGQVDKFIKKVKKAQEYKTKKMAAKKQE